MRRPRPAVTFDSAAGSAVGEAGPVGRGETPPDRGLTRAEVERRIAEGRTNHFHPRASRGVWSIVRANVFTLFNGIIAVCFVALLAFGRWQDALFGFSALGNLIIGSWQELRHWPPRGPALGPLRDAVGATLLPTSQTSRGIAYELPVGYTILDRSQIAVRRRLDVYYTVDGKDYVYRAPAGIVFCPSGVDDDTCMDAARDAVL